MLSNTGNHTICKQTRVNIYLIQHHQNRFYNGYDGMCVHTSMLIVIFHLSKPGTEFLNSSVQKLFKQYGVKHFTTDSDTKASLAER